MVSMKNIAWKTGAAVTLAAAIVGLSAGQASAAGTTEYFSSTRYEGPKLADVSAKANAELPALIARCVKVAGRPGQSHEINGVGSGYYTAQLFLPCDHG